MANRTQQLSLLLITTSFLLLQGCVYDLRTKTIKRNGITADNTKLGKEILDRAWKKQGLDLLDKHEVYSYHGSDTWKGVFGRMGKIWPELKEELDFKYEVGTFNGQVTFKSAAHNSNIAGLQNWNYYEINNNDTLFKPASKNKRKVFGIAAFQYFTEMVDRIRNAPIISYAGEREFRGQKYDLVFCTWEKAKPHMEHDQYIAWINKKTGVMDFTQYSIRENYLKLPGYKMIGGGVEFTDLRVVDGVMIPHEQLIYAINIKKNKKKFLHRLLVSNFKFDDFPIEDLLIDKSIQKRGDFKN